MESADVVAITTVCSLMTSHRQYTICEVKFHLNTSAYRYHPSTRSRFQVQTTFYSHEESQGW